MSELGAVQHLEVAIRNTFLEYWLVGTGEDGPPVLQHQLLRSRSAPELSLGHEQGTSCTGNAEVAAGATEFAVQRDLTFDLFEEGPLSWCEPPRPERGGSQASTSSEVSEPGLRRAPGKPLAEGERCQMQPQAAPEVQTEPLQRQQLHLPSLLGYRSPKELGKRRPEAAWAASPAPVAATGASAYFVCFVPTALASQVASLMGHALSVAEPSAAREGWAAAAPLAGRPDKAAKKGRRRDSAETRTTVMLRSLPDGITREILLETMDKEGFAGKYDFVYVPVDFRTHVSTAYAFINMVSAAEASKVMRHFHGFVRWPMASRRPCSVGWSDPYQGFDANVARYRNSPLMHELVPDSYRPVTFSKGVRVEFPAPTKTVKAPRKGTERMLV